MVNSLLKCRVCTLHVYLYTSMVLVCPKQEAPKHKARETDGRHVTLYTCTIDVKGKARETDGRHLTLCTCTIDVKGKTRETDGRHVTLCTCSIDV